jgi:hypothetical protein
MVIARSFHRWLLGVIAASALTGTGQAAEPPSYDSYLAQGYREMAVYALNRLASPEIAAHFATRAELTSRQGTAVEPEAVESWTLDRKLANEARTARRQLMRRLGSDARWASPLTSAIAVLNFDCWLSFATVDRPSSAECRRRFTTALQALPARVPPGPALLPVGPTTTLIALQACAAPPWLGDCPTPRAERASPGLETPWVRHAARDAGASSATLADGEQPVAISALAEVAADQGAADADVASVPAPPALTSLAETGEPPPADAPAE